MFIGLGGEAVYGLTGTMLLLLWSSVDAFINRRDAHLPTRMTVAAVSCRCELSGYLTCNYCRWIPLRELRIDTAVPGKIDNPSHHSLHSSIEPTATTEKPFAAPLGITKLLVSYLRMPVYPRA